MPRGPHRTHYLLGLPPFRAAWLHRVAPGDAGVWAGALRQLLSDPDMVALISATPRMRRILRPLCFMLGLEASLLRPPAPAVADMADVAAERMPRPAASAAAPPPGARDEAPPGVTRCAPVMGREIFALG